MSMAHGMLLARHAKKLRSYDYRCYAYVLRCSLGVRAKGMFKLAEWLWLEATVNIITSGV